mgnify:CR=1 FL=1
MPWAYALYLHKRELDMDLLKDTLALNVQYCKDSGVDIWHHAGFDLIEIRGDGDFQDVEFIQGDDARKILAEADLLFNELGDITYHEALCHLVKPYVEAFLN